MTTMVRMLCCGMVMAVLCGCGTFSNFSDSVGDYSDKVFNKYLDKILSPKPVIKPAALVKFDPTAHAKILWQAKAGDADPYVFSPLITGSEIYIANAKGRITRYNEATGKSESHIDADTMLSGGVGGNGSIIMVGTSQGEVLAFDHDGKLLWKAQLGSEVLSAPQVYNGTAVVRGSDSRIFGLDIATGETKWTYRRQIPLLTVRTNASVVLDHGGVFVGFPDGRLVALAYDNGTLGWEAAVALPKGATELERVTDVSSPPVIDDRQICAVAFQGRVACFDVFSGTLLWDHEISSDAGLTIEGGDLYVSDDKSIVVAYDKSTGDTEWKQDKLYGRQITAPVAIGRLLAVGDYQGYVHFLARSDGALAARVATDGSPIIARPVAIDEGILVVTQKGGVFVIAVE